MDHVDDESKKLTPGKELEEALLCVNASDYIELLDKVREPPETCRAFVTLIARSCPQFFEKYANQILKNPTWDDIDVFIRSGHKIQAIKKHREMTGQGLKDSKFAVEERMRTIGY